MAEAHLAALVGRRVSLPGHFDAPVILEDVRPLGADGAAGYECRVRLPDGALDEAVISAEEAAAVAAAVSRPEKVGKRPKRHGPRARSLPDGASAADAWRRRLTPSVSEAWRVFDRTAGLPSRVTPAAPILFFGDLAAYRASPLRVLTVGLNPSLYEFPAGKPFRRFPLLNGGSTDREPNRYLDAMSAYFHTHPYRRWFSAFERVLDGAGTSYYTGKTSTALHTDICSPVATDPTWRKLGKTDRADLQADGGPLWHTLLETLWPHMVVLSVARAHLGRIEFAPVDLWRTIHEIKRKRDGGLRSTPYEVRGRWYEAGGERSLFVFGRAARTPFGSLSDNQKHEQGAISLETYRASTCAPICAPNASPRSGAWGSPRRATAS